MNSFEFNFWDNFPARVSQFCPSSSESYNYHFHQLRYLLNRLMPLHHLTFSERPGRSNKITGHEVYVPHPPFAQDELAHAISTLGLADKIAAVSTVPLFKRSHRRYFDMDGKFCWEDVDYVDPTQSNVRYLLAEKISKSVTKLFPTGETWTEHAAEILERPILFYASFEHLPCRRTCFKDLMLLLKSIQGNPEQHPLVRRVFLEKYGGMLGSFRHYRNWFHPARIHGKVGNLPLFRFSSAEQAAKAAPKVIARIERAVTFKKPASCTASYCRIDRKVMTKRQTPIQCNNNCLDWESRFLIPKSDPYAYAQHWIFRACIKIWENEWPQNPLQNPVDRKNFTRFFEELAFSLEKIDAATFGSPGRILKLVNPSNTSYGKVVSEMIRKNVGPKFH